LKITKKFYYKIGFILKKYIENKSKLKNGGTTTRRRPHQGRSTTASTWASNKPPEQENEHPQEQLTKHPTNRSSIPITRPTSTQPTATSAAPD
jgi:hypothetical protein